MKDLTPGLLVTMSDKKYNPTAEPPHMEVNRHLMATRAVQGRADMIVQVCCMFAGGRASPGITKAA